MDIKFKIAPHLILKEGNYYLEYQIDVPSSGELPLKRVVYCTKEKNRAFYYFSNPISHLEKGELINRPLKVDGIVDHAKNQEVYWLNVDKSMIKLELKDT